MSILPTFPILPMNRQLLSSEPAKGRVTSLATTGIQYSQDEAGTVWQGIIESVPMRQDKRLTVRGMDIAAAIFTNFENDHQFAETLFQFPHHGIVDIALTLTQPNTSVESPEMNWLRNHFAELERHRGEWLLLMNDQLIAH